MHVRTTRATTRKPHNNRPALSAVSTVAGSLLTAVLTFNITPGKDWLQLSVPANRTLVSDFDLWNRFVVQYRYVPENDDDADRWDRRVRRVLKVGRAEPTPTVSAGWPESFVRATIASWSRVFDVAPGRPAQCAVEALYDDDVIEVLPAPLIADVPVEYRVNTSTYIVQPKDRRR